MPWWAVFPLLPHLPYMWDHQGQTWKGEKRPASLFIGVSQGGRDAIISALGTSLWARGLGRVVRSCPDLGPEARRQLLKGMPEQGERAWWGAGSLGMVPYMVTL